MYVNAHTLIAEIDYYSYHYYRESVCVCVRESRVRNFNVLIFRLHYTQCDKRSIKNSIKLEIENQSPADERISNFNVIESVTDNYEHKSIIERKL